MYPRASSPLFDMRPLCPDRARAGMPFPLLASGRRAEEETGAGGQKKGPAVWQGPSVKKL
ncbi:hypothetical protein GCM10010372_34350 [Streptomyces tauricus]|nr:hypothetical protein GCM10010372_34350 [Streptomyces tauricus]